MLGDVMYKLKEYGAVYAIGGVGYALLEILWRGYTHWSMMLPGGLCFMVFYHLCQRFPTWRLWKKCLAGCLSITVIEFAAGVVVNLIFRLNVWDYSALPLHLLGQICLPYTLLWFLLCIPLVFFSNFLRGRLAILLNKKSRRAVTPLR